MAQTVRRVGTSAGSPPAATATDRPPTGLAGALCLGVAGGVLIVAERTALSPAVTASWHWEWAREAAETARPWLRLGTTAVLVLAAVLMTIWIFRSIRYHRRRRTIVAITQAAANTLRVDRHQLQLKKARWRHGQVVSADLRYRSAHLVVHDASRELLGVLGPYLAGRCAVQWNRRRQRFVIRPREARLDEQFPAVQRLAAALSHVVGELTIDPSRTTVDDEGSVQSFVARYRHTTKDIGDGFRLRIQTIVDAKAPSSTGYWSVAWTPAANEIELRPAAPLPTVAPYPADLPELVDQMRIPLGVGEGDRVVYWSPESLPHMLLVGPTGTGKTIFLFSLLVSCMARGWSLILADPKELSFRGFDPQVLLRRGLEPWPGIDEIATSESAMEHAIAASYDRMRDRYAALKHFEVKEQDLRPLLVVVDETGELVERLNEYQQSPDKKAQMEAEGRKAGGTKNPELRKLWSNLRLGRQGRVFVVTATQRPDVTFIPGEARSNLTTRVGLGRLEGPALEMVFNTRVVQQRMTEIVKDPVTGERVAKRIRGRANVDVGGGPQTIQTYWVPDPAKLITGELTPTDMAAIHTLQDLVHRSRGRWDWQREAPAAGELKPELERDSAAAAVLSNAEQESATAEPDPGPAGGDPGDPVVPASALRSGMRVLMVLEDEEVEVEIEEITEDPLDPDLLELTVRPETGQSTVTTVDPAEEFVVVQT